MFMAGMHLKASLTVNFIRIFLIAGVINGLISEKLAFSLGSIRFFEILINQLHCASLLSLSGTWLNADGDIIQLVTT